MPKIEDDIFYGEIVKIIAKRSYAKRKQVGAIAIKDKNIIAYGFNGTPTGCANICETDEGVTKKDVLHAELNLICKCAKSGISLDGATIYVTLSPCIECAKMILQCGIKKVIFFEKYRIDDGIDFLKSNNIEVIYKHK